MKILHLTLKKQWFDMIASGEKKEEYREPKYYWFKRLVERIDYEPGFNELIPVLKFKHFDIVRFKNGYAKDAPEIDVKVIGISEANGLPEWGAEPLHKYFVIKLGEIYSTTGIKKF